MFGFPTGKNNQNDFAKKIVVGNIESMSLLYN